MRRVLLPTVLAARGESLFSRRRHIDLQRVASSLCRG
ncbi:MAG TPA: putative leader peptide [Actinocrinis sp.]|nr:putative leader peptide [Actinocrinis sp.]